MSLQALSDYTIISRYSRYNKEKKRRETWVEMVDRVFEMHQKKYSNALKNEEFLKEFEFAKEMVKKKRVLGAQRILQFGGDPIFKHNAKVFNCFAKETEFITSHGVKKFSDFKHGDEVKVLTHKGQWRCGIVKNYGKQSLNEIVINRGKAVHKVYATGNHRWLLNDDQETTNLKVGDSLLASKNIFNFDYDAANPIEKLYWCYGLVFGDGTKVQKNGEYKYSMVRLCGKDKRFESRFLEMGFETSSPLSCKGDTICYTGKYLKTTPNPEVDSVELVRAFCAGYLAADGAKNSNPEKTTPFTSIQSSEQDHIDFIRRCFPMVGLYIVSETELTGQETNYGIRPYTISFKINNSLGREDKYRSKFNVIEINPTERVEDVWCLEVYEDNSFVLPFGITTGNCSYGYIDRPAAFNEAMYLLLCGCGVGFSVQTKHVSKLPNIQKRLKGKKIFVAEDSIEGWAECISAIMSSYFVGGGVMPEYEGYEVEFDLSNIRPEGTLIANQFKAPGPKGLSNSLNKIKELIDIRLSDGSVTLRSIDVYDSIMHFSDAVLSGGVRRSATICLFSKEDQEMMSAKTGDWYIKNPQRGRSNNSVLLVKDKVTKEEFDKIMESTRAFGEPGFVFSESEDIGYNPCVEIGLYPQTIDGRSGWQFCNLTEGNGKYCDTKEKFFDVCRASATLGTMQAGYTDFKYLSNETREITEKEALLGCSITGVMDNPDILLNPEIQRQGAEIIKNINKKISAIIGINQAARTTCIKPAGSTSCVLSSSSGIHPHHAKRYIRRVQANRMEFPVQHFKKINPLAVESSVWSSNGTDEVISFLCEVPKYAITKNKMRAVDLLESVKTTQQNWVEFGTNQEICSVPYIRHNVSNTITVKDDEWNEVRDYIFENRKWFAGISLLSASGDLDYPQAPFTSVLNEVELVEEYGQGALLASGLIVDGLAAFGNNLWAACDTLNGIGEKLDDLSEPDEPEKPRRKLYKTEKEYSSALVNYSIDLNLFYQEKGNYNLILLKKDWIRRANQFTERYFSNDVRKMCHCLKHCFTFKLWLDLKREYKEIDWAEVIEDTEVFVSADTLAGQACAGGSCELK